MKWILNSNKFKWIKQHNSMQCGGSHNSLIEKKGAYYTLVKNQLELGN